VVNIEKFKKSGVRAIYHRIPIQFLDEFRSEMASQGKFFKIRFRGPRFNTPSARFRGSMSKQSTCIKQDATHFSVYSY
jgi:hypothetical protein